jgi:putative ABC transport system permease protein
MFFQLISRNSKRNRKENGLFFCSLLISIIAFYIVLSLSHQDVMIFLTKLESDAVDRLMMMIPVFYGMTLFLLFFLIYYAGKFQLERRRHEFGVYQMMGMRRMKLFLLLLAEDFRNSVVSLLIGLPVAVLLSELISLITARLVGIGIIGHQISFSWDALLGTAAGFLLIKLAAFLILSSNISRQEIGSLLIETPVGVKKQMPAFVYAAAMLLGVFGLAAAYFRAISGVAWTDFGQMGITMVLGLTGTMVLFWGLRFLISLVVKGGRRDRKLHVFNFRQIEETVIYRFGILAICSILILAALCCFGAGVAIFRYYGEAKQHVLDYTFENNERYTDTAKIKKKLANQHLDTRFSELFEMKVGVQQVDAGAEPVFQMDAVLSALSEFPFFAETEVLQNNLAYATAPYLISVSSYNQLLTAAQMPKLKLAANEAAIYMDSEYITDKGKELLNRILETKPEVMLSKIGLHLTETLQTMNIVTDSSITLSFALILPDEQFEYYTQGEYEVYLNGILEKNVSDNTSLMAVISDLNDELNKTGLSYESYLQNMGRQLFYMVTASYITIYLAIIFLIIANTMIGVQFLIGQQKSNRRYRTLIHLGAVYDTLCRSARKQINWYFGVTTVVAALSSLFGVWALLSGVLPMNAKANLSEMMIVSAAMISVLCVIEYIYIVVVKRFSDRYLLTLIVPKREE